MGRVTQRRIQRQLQANASNLDKLPLLEKGQLSSCQSCTERQALAVQQN